MSHWRENGKHGLTLTDDEKELIETYRRYKTRSTAELDTTQSELKFAKDCLATFRVNCEHAARIMLQASGGAPEMDKALARQARTLLSLLNSMELADGRPKRFAAQEDPKNGIYSTSDTAMSTFMYAGPITNAFRDHRARLETIKNSQE